MRPNLSFKRRRAAARRLVREAQDRPAPRGPMPSNPPLHVASRRLAEDRARCLCAERRSRTGRGRVVDHNPLPRGRARQAHLSRRPRALGLTLRARRPPSTNPPGSPRLKRQSAPPSTPQALAMEEDLPALPSIQLGHYRHYKGGEYEVLGVVLRTWGPVCSADIRHQRPGGLLRRSALVLVPGAAGCARLALSLQWLGHGGSGSAPGAVTPR